jgi:Ca-activated chloride channel family protein
LASPWVLLTLPLPILVYWFVPATTKKQGAVVVPFFEAAKSLQQHSLTQPTQRIQFIRLLLLTALWLLLVLAAARPQWVGNAQVLPNSGRDLLLAVDISDSMSQEDMGINQQPISRLLAVKDVVSEFIQRRQGDRIGLILFGTNAYLQAPLTFDTDTVKQFLEEAQLGFAGPQTAIGDAIGLSVKRLKERSQKGLNQANSQVIILLTDGANTAGEVEPLQAAKLAKQINTKIYTIGIGADEMVVRSFFGRRRINPSVALDEDTLKTIADTTGGTYFRARNTKELNGIYQELDKLEPVEQADEWLRPIRSLFMWPLGIALLLSIAYSVILNRYALVLSLKHLQRAKSTLKKKAHEGGNS